MKKFILFVVSVVTLVFAVSSFANLKIGVVDMQKIMQSSPKVAAAGEKLRKQFAPQQNKMMAKQKELKALAAKLKRDDSIMKDSDKQKLQSQIAAVRKSLSTMAQGYQQKVVAAQQGAMGDIVKLIDKAVKKIAKKQSLNMVVVKQAVVYLGDQTDITAQVEKALK